MAAAAEEEVVGDYRSSLEDLKMNSKPLINMLTMLAEENKQFAAEFVQVIEDRALKAPPSEKLPAMYLIDSIIKNLSDSNYLQLFSKNIVTTFAAVFEKVDEKTRSALFKLRHTWNELFPMKILYSLDLGVRNIDPAWPVLPVAKIHVNPKFLPKVQPDEQKLETEDEASCKNQEQQRIQEENRESCSQLENDILLKQQLMAKQQEILKLHQQRLEFELAKARAQIELQAKLLQKEKDAAKEREKDAAKEREKDAAKEREKDAAKERERETAKERERETAKEKEMDSGKRVQPKESASIKKHPSTTAGATKACVTATEKNSAIRSSNRDPRIRATIDLRASKTMDSPQDKHTTTSSSSKSDSGTSMSNVDSVASSDSALGKASRSTSGNIFDRLQDLSSSNDRRSPAKKTATHSGTNQSSAKFSSTEGATVKGDNKKTEENLHPGKHSSEKDKSFNSKSSPQRKKSIKEVSKKLEKNSVDGVQKTSSSTKSVTEDRLEKDSNSPLKRSSKSIRPRSAETSDHPPSKVIKRSEQRPHVSNFKSGPMSQRPRKNSIREDRGPSKGRGFFSEKRFENRKRSQQNESSYTKGLKKAKSATESEMKDAPHPLSDDIMELFGNEDKDYRCLSRAGVSPSGACVEPSGFKDLLMAPPARRRDSLLLSPSIPSSQSSGWAQFKASRPEDFPFQQNHSRDSLDGDIRSSLLVSPSIKVAMGRRAPLLPTPLQDDVRDVVSIHASGSSGNLSGQVTMDALEKQMTELHRLQDMKRKLDEQREHLIRSSSLPSFSGAPNVSPIDSQFTELHRLQNLKRNLDEQQERLQAMIDSGMKISDEFSSVFPAFGKDLHPVPQIHNKYLDVDESSRSPIFRENSPRRDRGLLYTEQRSGLLGDRPSSCDPAFEHRSEESKALLPTPGLVRAGNTATMSNREIGRDIVFPCEDERFYYPERDPRWTMRAQMHGSRSSNVYNVVIDGRYYEMTFMNRPLKIWHDRQEIVVRLDPSTRTLWCNDNPVYRLGEEEKSIKLNGKPHRVFVQGPPKKLWIDSQLFDIGIDSPPEKINIGGKEHKICIDGGKNRIIVDGFDICPFGTDEQQVVKLAFVMHTIQFHPPCKQILIDGNLCNLDLSGKYPFVIIDGKTRGIRFDGPPQAIFVDDKSWTVPVDTSRRCHLDGPSSKPVILAFGGPGHEVIVDDQWYELKFGGVEKYIKVGRKMRKFQLKGSPPEVKILGEVALTKNVNNNGRVTLLPDDVSSGRPSLMRGFGSGAHHHHTAPDAMYRSESSENIPSLLNLDFNSQMERSRSCGQFLGSRTHEGFNKNFSLDRQMHGQGHGNGMQPIGPHGRPMDGLYGPSGAYDHGQHHEDAVRGIQFGDPVDPRLRLSQNNEFSHQGMHDQSGHMPFRGQAPQHMGLPQPDHSGPPFELDMHQSAQNFNQLPYGGGGAQAPWITNAPFSTSDASQESSTSAPVSQQEVDVNNLLSKLLAAGLIKKTSESDSSNVASSGAELQALRPPNEQKSEMSDGKASEEEEAKKEDEIMEDIPDLTDFNLENLKKKYSGIIQRLYLGVQCQTCGIRFLSTAMDKYNEHLDWHFRQNRREKEELKVAKFRRWYYDVVDWIQFEELSSADDPVQPSSLLESMETSKVAPVLESQASNVITCPMASRNDKDDICDTCRESFEQFWDEEKEAWHLKDAIQVDGKTYHPICYEDVKDVGASIDEEDTSVLEVTAKGETLESQASSEQDNEITQATEFSCDPKTEDNAQEKIMRPLDNLQPNKTEVQTDTLIKPELLDKDEIQSMPQNTSDNICTSDTLPLENDREVKVKSEVTVSSCPTDEIVATCPIKEEGQNESSE